MKENVVMVAESLFSLFDTFVTPRAFYLQLGSVELGWILQNSKDMKVKTIEIAWHRRPEANHNDPVLSVDFLDDSIFATGGGDHEVKVQSWWMVSKDRFGD